MWQLICSGIFSRDINSPLCSFQEPLLRLAFRLTLEEDRTMPEERKGSFPGAFLVLSLLKQGEG